MENKTKKITKKDIINMMLKEEVIAGNPLYKDFLNHEIELLDKKATSRKSAFTTPENEDLMNRIMAVVDEKGATVSDLQKRDSVLAPLSNQKVSALVRFLESDGKVIRVKNGKNTLVKLV